MFTSPHAQLIQYTRCLGIRRSSLPPGPHGQPESCSYHMSCPTLSFSLTGVSSGYSAPKHAKRNRLRRRTKTFVGIAAKKTIEAIPSVLFLASFSTSFLGVSGRTKAPLIYFVFFIYCWKRNRVLARNALNVQLAADHQSNFGTAQD